MPLFYLPATYDEINAICARNEQKIKKGCIFGL